MAKNSKVVFKAYTPSQAMLLPPSLQELIAATHPVRVVNQIIDSVNLQTLKQSYKGGGTSSYHPCMLLKIWVYGYLSNIYSSRKLEAATKENIAFMWLAAMQQPDPYHQQLPWQAPAAYIKKHLYPGSGTAGGRRYFEHQRHLCGWHQDRSQCQSLHLCLG